MSINYVNGDATTPFGDGQKIIIHCCNDIGAWGAGFVLALSKKWPDVEAAYRKWFLNDAAQRGASSEFTLPLGEVQFVPATQDIEVGNMIGQHGVGKVKGVPPIKYAAIKKALKMVANRARALNASVHAPKFGAGLAGGDWIKIEKMIDEELIQKGIPVTIYEYAGN